MENPRRTFFLPTMRPLSVLSVLSVLPVLLLLLLPTRSVLAARGGNGAVEPFSISPRDLLALPRSQASTAEDLTHSLIWQDTVRFDALGRRTMRFHRIYRILSPVAVENADKVTLRWSPWLQEAPILKARVITPAGEERWLDPGTISQQNVGGAGESSRRLLTAPLPALEVGAVVEFTLTTPEVEPLLPGGGTRLNLRLGTDTPAEGVRLEISAPKELAVRQRVVGLEGVEPEVTEEDGTVRWVIRRGPMSPEAPSEGLLPPEATHGAMWLVTTGESWSAVAAAYGARVREALARDPEEALEARLAQASSPASEAPAASARRAQVAALVRWLHQQVRVEPLDLGQSPVAPRSPLETLERGVGESKDLAVLLVALLRQKGLDASVALVQQGWGEDVDPDLPGFGGFNHVLVHLPGEGTEGPLWIDPTARFARPGELPLTVQNRWALAVSGSDGKGGGSEALLRTPQAPSVTNLEREVRRIALAPLGPATVEEVTTVGGETERDYRENFAGSSREQMEERLTEYATGWLQGKTLADWQASDPEDLTGPFTLQVRAEDSTVGYTDLIEAVVLIATTEVLGDLPTLPDAETAEESGPVQEAVYLPKPYRAEVVYRVTPPAGYRLRETPPPVAESWGPATYQRTVTTEEDGTVEVVVAFDTGARRLPVEVATALGEGVRGLEKEAVLRLYFDNIAEAHLAAGELGAALEELTARIAAEPENGLLYTHRARVFQAAGLGEKARQEIATAAALAPEIPVVRVVQGLILQHDPFGRQLRGAFDYAGAAQAFREALALEEDSRYFRNLAVHLEHNPQGDHRGPGALLDEAIAVLRRHREKFGQSPLDSNLLGDLYATERWQECLELLEALPDGVEHEAVRVAVLAITEGPTEALGAAEGITDGERRNAVLGTAVSLLVQGRHYPPVVALARALAASSPDAVDSLSQITVLAAARRHEALPVPEDPVEAFLHRAFKTLFLGSAEEIVALFSPRLGEERLRREIEDEWSEMTAMRRGAVEAGGVELILDLTLGVMEFQPEEAPAGIRVKLRGPLASQGLDGFYLVHDDGELRILADADELYLLGGEALRRLAGEAPSAEDLAAARQWLDWARDGLNAPRDADDPFAGDPFALLWRSGQEATVEELRLAAAALASSGAEDGEPEARAAVPILEKAWTAVTGPVELPLPEGAATVAAGLLQAYRHAGQWEEAAVLATELLEREPLSDTAFASLAQAVTETGQWEILWAAARVRQEIVPDDTLTLRQLAFAAAGLGDWQATLDWQQRAVDSDHTDAGDLNQLAWYQILAGRVDDTTVDLAQRSVAGEGEGNATAALHTLATAYADLDQPREAIEVLRQVLDQRRDDRPEADDWYILGRIAEHYGLREYAATVYHRVTAEDSPVDQALGTAVLAQRRLQEMAALDGMAAAASDAPN
jgi:tetratricopeptide (TPR) repeat protein